MAKVEIKKSVNVILSLTEDEAKWLKGTVQNPIGEISYEGEDKFEREIRETIWDALSDLK